MGAGLAAATIAVLSPLPGPIQLAGLAILLGVAGGVYPGFAASAGNGQAPRGLTLEWVVAVSFAVVALAGLAYGPVILAAGWTLHAVWDAAHHRERLGAPAPESYPWLCLSYDLVIAGYLVWGGRAAFPPLSGIVG